MQAVGWALGSSQEPRGLEDKGRYRRGCLEAGRAAEQPCSAVLQVRMSPWLQREALRAGRRRLRHPPVPPRGPVCGRGQWLHVRLPPGLQVGLRGCRAGGRGGGGWGGPGDPSPASPWRLCFPSLPHALQVPEQTLLTPCCGWKREVPRATLWQLDLASNLGMIPCNER